MSLTPVINVDITIDSTGVPRQGFGTSLIASHNATWPERTRTYGATLEVADDWPTDSPEYLMAAAIFSQANPPEEVKIGRVAASVLQQYTVQVTSALDGKLYSLAVSGEDLEGDDVEVTADSATSVAELHSALLAGFNAFPDKTFTAAFAPLVIADKTFVGEADDETLTSAVPLVIADGIFTAEADTEVFTKAAHGRSTGDGPVQVSNGGGALPAGLAALTDYWFIRIDADNFYLASSLANALAGTNVAITTDGTGVQTYSDTAETRSVVAHGLVTGDGPVQLTTTGGLPTGLLTATDYWLIKTGTYTFKLAASLALALAGTAVALTTDGTGVQTMSDTVDTKSPALPFTVTGDASGNWFSISTAMSNAAYIALSQTHAAGTLDADLAEILDEDDEWYCLLTLYNSYAYAREAAAWAQANGRVYVFDCNDTEALTTAFDIEAVSGTDLIGSICALGYSRVMSCFHQRPSAFFAAAWMGRWLPTTPGKATAALKTLVGVETTKLKTTHFNNLEARRGNSYIFRGGRGITWESKVASVINLYLDVTRNVDYLIDGVETIGFGILAGAEIIPYTADGVAQLAGGVRGFLTGEAIDNGVLDRENPPNVIPPKQSTIPVQDKKERVLRTMKFSGRLSGAIHAADINGTVTF